MTITAPILSIIVPTRERAAYLHACLATCLLSARDDYEVIVLDNASADGTSDVVGAITDRRLRYARSDQRLSMRDNFERGFDLARGVFVGFIGDDDGLFEFTQDRVIGLFSKNDVDAVSAARAHYGWPDLISSRRNTGLVPRKKNVTVQRSRGALRHLLRDSDYYKLPCIYHGFVRASRVAELRERQGRLFLSSQVDMFSTIALSMENIGFAYSASPLVINGGSSRSNGAAHFGGGADEEKRRWVAEDELGFLPGFGDHATVASLIIESAIRYCQDTGRARLDEIFPHEDIRAAMSNEYVMRRRRGKPAADFEEAWISAGLDGDPGQGDASSTPVLSRLAHLIKAYGAMRPIDLGAYGVRDVLGASHYLADQLARGATSVTHSPLEQTRTALRIMRAKTN